METKIKVKHTSNLGDGSPCGIHICSIPLNKKANATFIVRACNAHDALVDACKKIRQWDPDGTLLWLDVINSVESALKLAEGE